MISGDLMYDSDQLTLTCISTGGPATNVTWTRDSTTVTERTETVLNDLLTAQYTHTLNVTTAGVYTCTVANDKPSSASASFSVTVTGMIMVPCDRYDYGSLFVSFFQCKIARNLKILIIILIEKTLCLVQTMYIYTNIWCLIFLSLKVIPKEFLLQKACRFYVFLGA